MSDFQMRYRNQTIDINVDELIRRANAYWYKLELPGRVKSCEYVRIPWIEEYEFTCAEPPPIQGCAMPPRAIVLYVSPDMAKSINHAIGVEVRIAA